MRKRKSKKIIIVLLFTMIISLLSGCAINPLSKKEKDESFRLAVPSNWELDIGDSRSVDAVFGYDVLDRKLTWTVSPSTVACVDKWGRVTGLSEGVATVTATTSEGKIATAKLKVVSTPTLIANRETLINKYTGEKATYGDTLQKIVTRWKSSEVLTAIDIPQNIKDIYQEKDKSSYKETITADGCIWSITDYGVLRVDPNAKNIEDKEQRFMSERYFATKTTGVGEAISKKVKSEGVLAIVNDGLNGIWTITDGGITHIEMLYMTGKEKAEYLVEDTEKDVMRHGYTTLAIRMPRYNFNDYNWHPWEDDNDGLWTSKYAVGELMRYASLKESGASQEDIDEAYNSALKATEAVLLLSNITMREGTIDAYVRYQPNGLFDYNGVKHMNGEFLSDEALVSGGDYSVRTPSISPYQMYENLYSDYSKTGKLRNYCFDRDFLAPLSKKDWKNPLKEDAEYEYRTRNLEGYVARTYSFVDEIWKSTDFPGYMHWTLTNEGTAVGYTTRKRGKEPYYINGEYNKGFVTNASGEIPERLWNDLIDEGRTIDQIRYKADTSQDELIGHFFLYKTAYDILKDKDEEITKIIVDTCDRIAQHITDNSYMMVDGSGQPNSWTKFNREFLLHSQQMGGAPLTSIILLTILKTTAYVTGYQKWEDEYNFAATDKAYEYAKIATQYTSQCELYMANYLKKFGLKFLIKKMKPETKELLTRMFINYADEELAMLAYYNLFSLEKDDTLLSYYRDGIDCWWESISYAQNPFFNYVYLLSRNNNETVKDAYGNEVNSETAWILSRHVMDTTRYRASNAMRDDYAELNFLNFKILGLIKIDLGIMPITVDLTKTDAKVAKKIVKGGSFSRFINIVKNADKIVYGIPAADEKNANKHGLGPTCPNDESRHRNEPERKDACETYTLPFWLGIYHGLLEDIEEKE